MSDIRLSAAATRIGAAVTFLALALGAIWESLRLQALPGGDAVGSGAFPGLAALGLAFGAVWLLSGWRDTPEALAISNPLRVFAALIAMIAFVAGLGQLPILAVVAAFVAGFQVILGERRAKIILGGSLCVTAAIWVLFGLLLNVPL